MRGVLGARVGTFVEDKDRRDVMTRSRKIRGVCVQPGDTMLSTSYPCSEKAPILPPLVCCVLPSFGKLTRPEPSTDLRLLQTQAAFVVPSHGLIICTLIGQVGPTAADHLLYALP